MDIEGTIVFDLPLQEGIGKTSGKPWKKKEWVLETFGTYPRRVKFTVFGETRVNELQFEVGKSYRISVDAESREFNGRWYTDLTAYAMVPLEGGMPGMASMPQSAPGYAAAPAQAPQAPATDPFSQPIAGNADPFASGNDNTDDLPF